MTLEEAKSLANQGDLESIMALGRYYFGEESSEENRDINEAIKWYEKGAEFGYANCMQLVSILYWMKGHTTRMIVGGECGIELALDELDKSLYWAKETDKLGYDGADKRIISAIEEKGIVYFFFARGGEETNKPTNHEKAERYEKSIDLLKSVYKSTSNPEVYIYLALALNYYGELAGYNESDNILEFELYHKCVDEYFGEVIHSDFAAVLLAEMYTFGRGCNVDYDKAVYYLQKAHNSGLDCSQQLSLYKKKLFGGYTLA